MSIQDTIIEQLRIELEKATNKKFTDFYITQSYRFGEYFLSVMCKELDKPITMSVDEKYLLSAEFDVWSDFKDFIVKELTNDSPTRQAS